jgi:hypothetical protein
MEDRLHGAAHRDRGRDRLAGMVLESAADKVARKQAFCVAEGQHWRRVDMAADVFVEDVAKLLIDRLERRQLVGLGEHQPTASARLVRAPHRSPLGRAQLPGLG